MFSFLWFLYGYWRNKRKEDKREKEKEKLLLYKEYLQDKYLNEVKHAMNVCIALDLDIPEIALFLRNYNRVPLDRMHRIAFCEPSLDHFKDTEKYKKRRRKCLGLSKKV